MKALRNRDFRYLWLAGLISDTGDWLLLASLPIAVFLYTGSTLGTAIAFITALVPPIVLAPLAGTIADRFDAAAYSCSSASPKPSPSCRSSQSTTAAACPFSTA